MDFNHLPDHTVREGMVLKIPPNVVESSPPVRHQQVHVVKRGEDFWDIADHYKIKPSVLAKANPDVNPNRIHADMKLNIPVEDTADKSPRRDEPTTPRPKPASMVQHTVGEDETFYSIGRRYGVTMEAVVAANPDMPPERLRAGMKVWVPSKNPPASPPPSAPPAKQPAPTKVAENTTPSRGRTHVVKENESIAIIAKKYAVSESALLRENKLTEDDPIYVDDVLKIPGSGSSATAAASSPPKAGTTPTKPTASTTKTGTTPTKPTASAAPPKSPASTPPNTVTGDGTIRSYIVSAGEDENSICEAFGISKQTLFDYNRLAATTKLKPGDEIAIPRVAKGGKR
jgi:LysM repeat protein